jgi:Skp family chaperone for outer membrane proteins
MKTFTKFLLASALVAPSMLVAATGAHAQAVAIADPNIAISKSKAFVAAMTQIRTQYKVQLDQLEARRTAIQKEIDPLLATLDTNHDGTVSDDEVSAAQAAKNPALATIQQKQAAAQQELGKLEEPAARAQAYAVEQISTKLQAALQAAIAERNVSVLLKPAAVMFVQPTSDLTPVITAKLDSMVPSVGINPPANWQPGQQGAAAPAAPAAPAAGTPPKKTTGR